MRSFRHDLDNRRATYLALVGSIESQLRDAYAKRHESGLDTQASLASKLGVNRSAVHHRLMGRTNMTIKTLADMVWALGQSINVKIDDPSEIPTNQKMVVSEFAVNNTAPQIVNNGQVSNVIQTTFPPQVAAQSGGISMALPIQM